MKPLDDMLPEESEPQYKELITLIQQASPRFAPVPSERQQRIISRVRARLMQADLETIPGDGMPILGAISSTPNKSKAVTRRHHLNVLVATLLMLVLFGTTLVFLKSGLSTLVAGSSGGRSLQVTPSTVPLYGTITLHGTNFQPNTSVGLMRDAQFFAIVDSNDKSIITTDGSGSFTDTIFVDAAWGVGPHIIYAEEATTHKLASSTLMVTGHDDSSRPPHLTLSQTALDLGTGDQATNSTATLTLADSGGGSITWQSVTTQPWLLLSPQQGIISGDQPMQVTVAVDRSKLTPGSYSGDLIFTSNAGKSIVSVTMHVIPLHPGNEAVMQVTPAALSFTATVGGPNPPPQTVTISNPGVQSFQWSTSLQPIAITNTGGQPLKWRNWLTVSPSSGNVAPQGASESVKIGVNTSTLLPGVYRGEVTFSNAGTQHAQNSPQSVIVSLTVQTQSNSAPVTPSPVCALSAAPVALTFAGIVGGSAPANQSATISASGACTSALNWSASVVTSSGGSWLQASPSSGTVSLSATSATSVGVSLAGLGAGTYTGKVTISATDSVTGKPIGTPQAIMITLDMTTTPVLNVSTPAASFNVSSGTASVPLTISNNGGQPLNWSAALAPGTPSYVSLSALAGSNLAGGTSTTTSLLVNTTGITTSQTLTIGVTISAVNPATNPPTPTAGSPTTLTVTITITPPAMQVNTTNLSFTATQGSGNPAAQTLTITNTGGGSLGWTVSSPSAGWLSASPRGGSNNAGASSPVTFAVNTNGLNPGSYSATLAITPSVGSPVTINITLVVSPGGTPTPLPTPNVTPAPGSMSLSS